MHLSIWIGLDSKSNCVGIHRCDFLHPNTPKYTQNTPKYIQIQLQIILFLLFWDVLWIINDLLAPLSLFFHEFQQNNQFLRTISNDPDLGRVAYNWVAHNHEYTQIYINISSFKSAQNNKQLFTLHYTCWIHTCIFCIKK